MTTVKAPHDPYCNRAASEIPEYVELARESDTTPDEEARGDGTFNSASGEFACTECYIRLGSPVGPRGWRAGEPVPQ